jgi:hypothetical protein
MQYEKEGGGHDVFKTQFGTPWDQVMKDEAGELGRLMQSLVNLIKYTCSQFEHNGGPLDHLYQGKGKIILALKENGLKEGQWKVKSAVRGR